MSERVDTDDMRIDDMHVVWPRAAGLDVHKMRITAAVRLCEAGRGRARTAVHEFSALPHGLREMTDWLLSHGVTAAAMEDAGVYWKAPFDALEDAGIDAALLNARQVKQIRGKKTDVSDSLWLARIRQFGLALPSHVPLASRLGYKRAILAAAHKLLRVIHAVLATTGPTPTRRSITNASSSSATRRAGSECSNSTASWTKPEPPSAPDSNAPDHRRRDGPWNGAARAVDAQ